MQKNATNPAAISIWLKSTISLMVEKPHRVSVETERAKHGGFVFHVDVGKNDLGRVIGTSGKNADGIRHLVRMMAKDQPHSYTVDIGSVEKKKSIDKIESVRIRKNANAESLEAFEKIMLGVEEREVAFA